jgi:uncharacterized damage-inducible protein DinB
MSDTNPERLLTAFAQQKLRDHFAQVCRCVGLLSEQQLWFRPNESSNSVANLLLHLCGNLGQWILDGLGGRRFDRNRPAEFSARQQLHKEQLLEPLRETVEAVCAVLRDLPDGAAAEEYLIQGYGVTGVAAVGHILEHFAFHTGQIVTATKWLLDVDLSLYDEHGRRRDGRHQGTP